ncbi:MAG: hypothetical protein JKY54_05315 [Flavobacteriales bacterium]|nr:hypothetical protein [Flavobacteriales bacterium]
MVRTQIIIALLFTSFVLNAQIGNRKAYFEIHAKNVAVSAAKQADSAYFEVKRLRSNASDLEPAWENGSIFKANAYLSVAIKEISACVSLIPGQFEPIEQLNASRERIDLALENLILLEDEAGSAYGNTMRKRILATIKYSSASSYHASILIVKGPDEPVVEDTIVEVAEVDTIDYVANRLQTDSVLFNKLLKIYELELLELRRKEKELIEQLENADLTEKERQVMEKELLEVMGDILERETKITQGRSQLENLDEEKKLVNNYLTSIAEYEEWDNIKDFPFDLDVELPEGLVYRVQIGYYPIRRKVLFETLQVDAVRASKKYVRYFTGIHLSYEEAIAIKEKVKVDYGIEDAFLVAYNDGEKLTIIKAIELEKTKDDGDQ